MGTQNKDCFAVEEHNAVVAHLLWRRTQLFEGKIVVTIGIDGGHLLQVREDEAPIRVVVGGCGAVRGLAYLLPQILR